MFLSVVLTTAINYKILKDTLNKQREFKVVDIKALSEGLMRNLEKTLKAQGKDLNPEFVTVIAQTEAKKMFKTITRASGKNDIIFSRTSVIHAPEKYDITEEIAELMGLEGVNVVTLHDELKAIDKESSNESN